MSETVLQLKDATIYQGESMVLTNVNFEMQKGDFVYLIGKTGSGKSSFMKTLYGDLELTEGVGSVVDFNLRSMKEKDIPFLRRKLGIVFQDFKLLPDRTINGNLEFVLKATGWKEKDKIKDRIESVLDKVGMKTKGFKFPHELSGGEQQRIAIARALLNDPELILADEPTGNLDFKTSQEIFSYFLKLKKLKKTIIFATHNRELANRADYKLLISNGDIKRVNARQ